MILPSCVSRIVHLHMDEVGFISQWRAIFAGGLAGVTAALVTYPLEVAETRLIVQNCRQPTYIGVVHTLSKIYRTEGLLALYRGFSLTVLGVFAYSYNNNRFLFFYFDSTAYTTHLLLFVNNTLSCNLQYIAFVFRCFPLFYRLLCGPHELGQALAGAPFSLHSPAELH